MSTKRMILQHTSGKYYEIVRVHGGDLCRLCGIRGQLCDEKGFLCQDLRDILGYTYIFKEISYEY